jgi:uncharacterized protein YjbI with pentapeptide repeats
MTGSVASGTPYIIVKLVNVVQQIKTSLRLSATKKQGFRDVGTTASFCRFHPNKTRGSDITGSDITGSDISERDNVSDIAGSDITGSDITGIDITVNNITGSDHQK